MNYYYEYYYYYYYYNHGCQAFRTRRSLIVLGLDTSS